MVEDDCAPTLIRRRALEAAVRAPRPWQKMAARVAFGRDDVDWKVSAVFAMGHLDGFEKEIVAAIDSEDEELQYEAIRAAGQGCLESAWKPVGRFLLSPAARKDLALMAVVLETLALIDAATARLIFDEFRGELNRKRDAELIELVDEAIELAEDEAALQQSYDEEYEDDEDFEF